MTDTAIRIRPLLSEMPLSKSRFVGACQCPLRLWFEVRTDAPRTVVDEATQARFDVGNEVGELARRRWDDREAAAGRPVGVRVTDDPVRFREGVEQTAAAIENGARVVHEASLHHKGVKVRIDVLERLDDGTYALHEVKSSTSYKADKHLSDVSVQLWAARGAGLEVSRVYLVHLNKRYVWQGGPYDLEDLFELEDVTEAAEAHQPFVETAVHAFIDVVGADAAPAVPSGTDCGKPYECPYVGVCPEFAARRGDRAADPGAFVPGSRSIGDGCGEWIDRLEYPLYHLDFETLFVALPLAIGTRPYQQVPVQYSLHIEREDGTVDHSEFLADANAWDPRLELLEHLVADLGVNGTVLQWSSFEASRIRELSSDPRYALYAPALRSILGRIRDLAEPVRRYVRDPRFEGSWSIKVVHPVLIEGCEVGCGPSGQGRVDYKDLSGVADGTAATLALAEYFSQDTPAERRQEIRRELLDYCELDTWAMVEVLRALRLECQRPERSS